MGMKIKIARISKGLKQYEMAKEVGISREYLRLIESGKANNPSIRVMKKISEILGENVQTLFFDEN